MRVLDRWTLNTSGALVLASCALILAPHAALRAQEVDASPPFMVLVRDRFSDIPIIEAQVRILETNQRLTGAASGFFVFEDPPSGEITIIASALGYQDTTVVRTVVSGDVVHLLLSPAPIEIEEISSGDLAEEEREAVRLVLDARERRPGMGEVNRLWEEDALQAVSVSHLSAFLLGQRTLGLRRFGAALCRGGTRRAVPASRRRSNERVYQRLLVFLDEVQIAHQILDRIPLSRGDGVTTRPTDVVAVEIYLGRGMVRAYTKGFMKRVILGTVTLGRLDRKLTQFETC